MALFWEIPPLPCAYMERLRQIAMQQISPGYRAEQASMTAEVTLIKSETTKEVP